MSAETLCADSLIALKEKETFRDRGGDRETLRWRMDIPVVFLGNAAFAHFRGPLGVRLVHHPDQAGQVELAVFTIQADTGNLSLISCNLAPTSR